MRLLALRSSGELFILLAGGAEFGAWENPGGLATGCTFIGDAVLRISTGVAVKSESGPYSFCALYSSLMLPCGGGAGGVSNEPSI